MGVKLLLQMMLLILLLFIKEASAQNRSVAKPDCVERCGDLEVPYPFGIGAKCSAYKTMEINCDISSHPPKAFLRGRNDNNVEVLNISLETGTIRINYPITTECTERRNGPAVSLSEPFTYSDTENRFASMGCSNHAQLVYNPGSNFSFEDPLTRIVGGCMSTCAKLPDEKKSCLGINCCQTKFQPSLQDLSPRFMNRTLLGVPRCDDKHGPRYAFIVDEKWFGDLEDINKVKTMEYVPAVLNWRTNGSCQSFAAVDPPPSKGALCGRNAFCNQSLCSCQEGYEGNPYLPDGCQDIDECATAKDSCQQICTNTPGSYTCSCKHGWVRVDNFKCRKKEVDMGAIIAIATFAGLAVLLATTWWLYKVIRRRRIRKLKEKFFKRNGGLLLRQKVSPSQGQGRNQDSSSQGPQGNVETIKVFTSEMLDKATDHYNIKNRISGQGGQGTVYKGMLTDGRIVAVKKSKIEDETKVEHFINEVVILSQINHRNIVKLHGCCLETEVPSLVYEFIPNRTLMQYIHEQNENVPLTWDVRVRVATEVADALYYLHTFNPSIPIYHRDIKSSNIILDNEYKAKVANFGTSRPISIDLQDTSGYLDPEYFQSSKFTEKSDVYSFGVVLVELFTGKKPFSETTVDDEPRSLPTRFSLAKKEDRILCIVDPRIAKEGRKEEMKAFADIACRCLNSDGGKRPTMKQVATDLENTKKRLN